MINRRQLLKNAVMGIAGAVAFPEVIFASNIIQGSFTERIIQAESNGNPKAYRKDTHARGLMQITPIVRYEWNNFHPERKIGKHDLYNPKINVKVGEWYLFERILGHYLPHYKLDLHEPNALASWNIGPPTHAGVYGDAIKNFKELPGETKEFIKKVTGKVYSNP